MRQLFVDCECGRKTNVTPAQCGGSVKCLCGRTTEVPRLRQLRNDNGLSNLTALDKLNLLGKLNAIRLGMGCVLCSVRQGRPHGVLLECQKPEILGESHWTTNLIVIAFGGIARFLHMSEQRKLTASGDERVARFSIEICADCMDRQAKRKKELHLAIRKIPEIDDVFREYPESNASIID